MTRVNEKRDEGWTRPLREESGYTCDWGYCDEVAVAERLDDINHAEWLPVCAGHLGKSKRFAVIKGGRA